MKKIGFTSITIIFTVLLFGQQPMFKADSIASYFEEVKLATKKTEKLWNRDLYGPILLVNPTTREIFANFPDSTGLLKKDRRLYKGYLPKEFNIANYVIHWGGHDWAMIMMNLLPSKKNDRVNLISHELFHRIQPALGFEFIEGNNKHLDKKEARIYMRLELMALKKALLAKGIRDVINCLTDALTFRKYRHSLYPGADSSENWLEINEGITEYTGLMVDGRNNEDAVALLVRKIDGFTLGDGSFVRSFPYRTIPAYGYLLSKSDKYWNKKITTGTNLSDFFIKEFGIQIPEPGSSKIQSKTAEYGLASITAEEIAREDRINNQIAEYKRKLTELPHLDIPCESMRMTANQGVQMPLEGWGTIYPSFLNASDKWGTLQVENGGVLIETSKTKISLPIPELIEGNIIKGSNWTLKLNEGYKIEKDTISENFRIVKL